MTFEEAKKLLVAFAELQVEYVLVGSIALAVQGIVRATRDIDFFISASDENVNKLRKALKKVFPDDPDIDLIDANDLRGDYPALQYVPPHQEYAIDLIARLGSSLKIDDLDWETLEIDNIVVKVATPETLRKMKKNSLREQDQLDARVLAQKFHLED